MEDSAFDAMGGLDAPKGYPAGAPVREAAIGGHAAGIAPVVAAVAAGGNESSALKQLDEVGNALHAAYTMRERGSASSVALFELVVHSSKGSHA